MKKFFKIAFVNLIFFLLLFLIPGQTKIDLRFALFSTFADSHELFYLKPKEIKNNNTLPFRFYKQKYIDAVLANNQIQPFHFEDTSKIYDRVQKIVWTYSKNGGTGCGTYSTDLLQNIKWLTKDDGHGCCSDHSQAFIALCIANNIFAREVHHSLHTFNEFFDEQKQKWVWIDSQCCIAARDSATNELLGFAEITDHFKDNQAIHWEYFGKSNHKLYDPNRLKVIFNTYYTKPQFDIMIMTLGNNVYEVDSYNKKLYYLPQEVRQFLLLSIGIQPSYLFVDKYKQKQSYLLRLKYLSISTLLMIFILNIYYIFKK